MKVAESERGLQTVNMMGSASTSEYVQNMIHYDPRNFLQFNIMHQPQYYPEQEDRKAFMSGKKYSQCNIVRVHSSTNEI